MQLIIYLIYISWIEEFVRSPTHGHIALIDLLKDLIQYPSLLNATKKITVLQRNPVGTIMI